MVAISTTITLSANTAGGGVRGTLAIRTGSAAWTIWPRRAGGGGLPPHEESAMVIDALRKRKCAILRRDDMAVRCGRSGFWSIAIGFEGFQILRRGGRMQPLLVVFCGIGISNRPKFLLAQGLGKRVSSPRKPIAASFDT